MYHNSIGAQPSINLSGSEADAALTLEATKLIRSWIDNRIESFGNMAGHWEGYIGFCRVALSLRSFFSMLKHLIGAYSHRYLRCGLDGCLELPARERWTVTFRCLSILHQCVYSELLMSLWNSNQIDTSHWSDLGAIIVINWTYIEDLNHFHRIHAPLPLLLGQSEHTDVQLPDARLKLNPLPLRSAPILEITIQTTDIFEGGQHYSRIEYWVHLLWLRICHLDYTVCVVPYTFLHALCMNNPEQPWL